MNIAMIIPTGLGCEIGGHAGDANPVAKLLASICDNLILHPNVVNASDINEMTENSLYVEGSILDRFLEGEIELKKVYQNKILLVANAPLSSDLINSVNAARVTLGAKIEILELKTELKMTAQIINGKASGIVEGWEDLVTQVANYNFDALAISSKISVSKLLAAQYLQNNGGINPWGGVEALASRLIADKVNKPVAHSPIDDKTTETYKFMCNLKEPVDPRMSAELVSVSYLHCILRGLHKAPQIGHGISYNEVNFLVSPYGCWGRPHKACKKAGIPIILVRENKTHRESWTNKDEVLEYCIVVDNYLEAAGVIQAYKAGISIESVRRPISKVKIYK